VLDAQRPFPVRFVGHQAVTAVGISAAALNSRSLATEVGGALK